MDSVDSRLLLSVVIPAFNEAKLIAGTIGGVRDSLLGAGLATDGFEIIVCDNASSDATAALAAQAGAEVVHEPERQIARARNTGASRARAPALLFLDADSWPDVALMITPVRLGGGGFHFLPQGRIPGHRRIRARLLRRRGNRFQPPHQALGCPQGAGFYHPSSTPAADLRAQGDPLQSAGDRRADAQHAVPPAQVFSRPWIAAFVVRRAPLRARAGGFVVRTSSQGRRQRHKQY